MNSLVLTHQPLIKQVECVGNSVSIPCFLISVGVLCNPRLLVEHPENLGLAAIDRPYKKQSLTPHPLLCALA